ncbi:hypothetical protein KKH82_01890 [Patescibacteria group bacterium]|nr:hypothetical protein [Patescibacteria group bacterium]
MITYLFSSQGCIPSIEETFSCVFLSCTLRLALTDILEYKGFIAVVIWKEKISLNFIADKEVSKYSFGLVLFIISQPPNSEENTFLISSKIASILYTFFPPITRAFSTGKVQKEI